MSVLKVVEIYKDKSGREPYTKWVNSLDKKMKARIQQRIRRLETGNLGDYKSIGQGVSELKLNFGPGYRIYYGEKILR